jgi:serine/threonine-protein kinase HipA
LVLFSFLTGNADMHLKNFSLLEQPGLGMVLSPAYDLVNTVLVYPADDEEMALNLNGKKKKLKKQDFVTAMNTLKLDEKQQENIFIKMEKAKSKWMEQIENSFMTDDFKNQYKQIVAERFERINM